MKLSAFMKREELLKFLNDLYETESSRFLKIETSEERKILGHKITIETTSDMGQEMLKSSLSIQGFLHGRGWGRIFTIPS